MNFRAKNIQHYDLVISLFFGTKIQILQKFQIRKKSTRKGLKFRAKTQYCKSFSVQFWNFFGAKIVFFNIFFGTFMSQNSKKCKNFSVWIIWIFCIFTDKNSQFWHENSNWPLFKYFHLEQKLYF